jgi:hypothetical protein
MVKKKKSKESKESKESKDFLSLKTKVKLKKILKPSQMTITIKKTEQEPYKPIYMKEFIENEKRSMFFS